MTTPATLRLFLLVIFLATTGCGPQSDSELILFAKQIRPGFTTIPEVKELLGEPDQDPGSGLYSLHYNLSDGGVIVVSGGNLVLDVEITDSDGKTTYRLVDQRSRADFQEPKSH